MEKISKTLKKFKPTSKNLEFRVIYPKFLSII